MGFVVHRIFLQENQFGWLFEVLYRFAMGGPVQDICMLAIFPDFVHFYRLTQIFYAFLGVIIF